MPTILIQTDANTLVQKTVTEAQLEDWARDFTIYLVNPDGTRGPAFGPTLGQGFLGHCTASNFGVNSIRYPINWDGVTTGEPTRSGVDGPLKVAVQPGNWVRLFFGFDGNGGGTTPGPSSGLFQSTAPAADNHRLSTYTGYQANGAATAGAATIALDVGAGAIPTNSFITFASHAQEYSVTAGVTGPGTVTLSPVLQHDVADNEAATVYGRRLFDLIYAIDTLHAAGLKVLICLEGYVPITDADMKKYRDRLDTMLRLLGSFGNRQSTFIDAIEPSNEVYQQQTDHGVSLARIAEMQRITYKLFKCYSPRTIVLSCSYQGGESLGDNLVLQMMGASAAGINAAPYDAVGFLNDSGGAGTTGEMFFDHIAYHPYVENISTIAAATAALTSSTAQLRFKDFIDPIRAAISNRRAVKPSYWTDRADPEIWATEWSVNPNGGVATTNSAFRMQYFTPAERALLIEQGETALRACGVTVSLPYAVDHHFTQGIIGELTKSAAPNGDLRVSTVGIDTPPPAILDGDELWVTDNVGWCYAYNCSEDGSSADFKNVSTGLYYPYGALAHRWQLGGWAEGYIAIQQKFIGYLDASWHGLGSSAVPQVSVNGGTVLRVSAGVLVDSGE